MPDDMPPIRRDAGSDRTERLISAIDRMMTGGPTPVLNDPELHDLLLLAARLRDELPEDLPDPAFRFDLKRQLTATGPVLVATPRPRTPSQPRFPWVTAVSALAAVMLAAISVGSLGIWLNDDGDGSSGTTELARFQATQHTASMLGFATMTAAAVPGGSGSATEPTTVVEPTSAQPGDAGEEPDDPEPSEAETVPPNGAAVTRTSPATQTTLATTTAESTPGTTLASVPPVDAQHVEQGPRAAADGSSGPAGDVDYVLETSLPDLGATAEVYRLIPPKDDPEAFVETVASALDFEGEITSDVPMGRTVYHIFDDAGSFHWTPETGAFTVSVTEEGTGEPLSADELTTTAIDWLESINYPVEHLADDVQAEKLDDVTWLLSARYAAMPDVGLGHQLGVTVFISSDGAIMEASGYWLDLKQVDAATLHSADAIWQAISSGQGYWTGGGIVEDGGEFRADAMMITYILTVDPSGDLVLQPVAKTDGEFVSADGGASARISCFVQAARTTGDNTP
jgi:hypothetical protein